MLNKEVYTIGEKKLVERLNEEIDNINRNRNPIDYDPRFGYTFEEVQIDEEEIWSELLQDAIDQVFSDEELYYAIAELETIEAANEFWVAVEETRRDGAAA